jgi:hypothetical protein
MDNVQKVCHSNTTPSPQTFRTYLQSVPNFVHPRVFPFIEKCIKSNFILKNVLTKTCAVTKKLTGTDTFYLPVTASLKFNLFKIGAKLGTVPLLVLFSVMTPQEVDCTTGASENVTVSFSIQFHQVKP